ncbi:MAG: hypothetical protein ACOY0T_37390 [Myxococcota bacterium]
MGRISVPEHPVARKAQVPPPPLPETPPRNTPEPPRPFEKPTIAKKPENQDVAAPAPEFSLPPWPERPPERAPTERELELLSIIEQLRKDQKRRSVFDKLRPKTAGGWAVGLGALITALGGGTGVIKLVEAWRSPVALTGRVELLAEQAAELRKDFTDYKEKIRERQRAEEKRWSFTGAALCKGAQTTTKGLDCEAVEWEARPLPKRGEQPPPWRARTEWPPLPETPK